ncbi:hypothetical protein ACROYT_G006112 [Oculina patagonica]
MVSFICNACGQTVRKVQVEKHYQNECRNCDVLSCIDCGKDFHGDEYVAHTSCITEAEKYQGKLYKPKDKQNKGEHKQQEWLKQVREATRSGKADPRLTVLLERISEYSNIPRKKAKFQNFCRNSINVRDSSTLDKLWEIFSESTKQSAQEGETNSNGVDEQGTSNNSQVDEGDRGSKKHKNGEKDDELDISDDKQESKGKKSKKSKDSKKQKKQEKLKDTVHESKQKSKGKKIEKDMNGNTDNMDGHDRRKKRKRRRNDEEEEEDEPQQPKVSKVEIEETDQVNNDFNWKSTIKAVLRQAPDQELPIKRLRKKVLAEFQAREANNKNLTENELSALFEKKVTKNPKFKVHKDRVKLIK